MTEQEKRENAICEMDLIFLNKCKAYTKGVCPKAENCRNCQNRILYDEGYRRYEEVQKETLQKLFSSVSSTAETTMKYSSLGSPIVHLSTLKILIKQEFSVEVEE